MRKLIVHDVVINGKVHEALFQIVVGNEEFQNKMLKEAIKETGDTTMRLINEE